MTSPLGVLKHNDLYNSTSTSFSSSDWQEPLPCIQGFILGMLAKGFKSSDRRILNSAIELFHNGDPLNGIGIANFTTLVIELERQVEQKKLVFFIPSPQDNTRDLPKNRFNQTRLESFHQLCYGLGIGLGMELQASSDNTPLAKTLSMYSSDPELNDDLHTLNEFSHVNTEAKLSESDFIDVCDYVVNVIYFHAKRNRKPTPSAQA